MCSVCCARCPRVSVFFGASFASSRGEPHADVPAWHRCPVLSSPHPSDGYRSEFTHIRYIGFGHWRFACSLTLSLVSRCAASSSPDWPNTRPAVGRTVNSDFPPNSLTSPRRPRANLALAVRLRMDNNILRVNNECKFVSDCIALPIH